MEKAKRNQILLWVAIILLSVNLAMVTAIWIKGKSNFKNKERSEHFKDGNLDNFENRMAMELNLNASQIEKIHELKKNHWKKMQPLRDSIQQKKWLIHQELMSKLPDTNYINLLSDTIGQLNADFEKLNYNHLYLLKEQLNEEQLASFKKVIECLPYGQDRHHERQQHKLGEK